MNNKLALALSPLALLVAACSGPPPGPSTNTDETSASIGTESEHLSSAYAPREGGQRIYLTSNDASRNEVFVYEASRRGAPRIVGRVATGGRGSGDGLGSQGALAVSGDGRWLLAVNAGSNELSLFRFVGDGLRLAAVVPSGGERPISVSESHGLVYVLNAGGTQSIQGFWLAPFGGLAQIEGSTRALSAATPVGAAEVAFSPDGNTLVVTEKATNTLDTFVVRRDGTPTTAQTTPSTGVTPFGFAFDGRGALVVSDAAGGAAGAGALTSYVLDGRGAPALVTGPVANAQAAPCWVAITPDNQFAYTANTASGTLSGYRVDASGALTVFDDGGVTANTGAGSKPADVVVGDGGLRLYVLEGGTSTLGAYRIGASGDLTEVGHLAGLPSTAVGLVVR